MLKISTMSGKLQGIDALNTSPLHNDFCIKMHKNPLLICSKCYSFSMLLGCRKNCDPRFYNNGEELKKPLTETQIKDLEFISDYLRINAHGELLNFQHLLNVVAIADYWQNMTVVLYTKKINLVRRLQYKPKNLIIVYSNPYLDKPITKIPYEKIDKVFNVITDKNDNRLNCLKKCKTCLKCYKINDENIIFELEKSSAKKSKKIR